MDDKKSAEKATADIVKITREQNDKILLDEHKKREAQFKEAEFIEQLERCAKSGWGYSAYQPRHFMYQATIDKLKAAGYRVDCRSSLVNPNDRYCTIYWGEKGSHTKLCDL